jgi:hypothetical protein
LKQHQGTSKPTWSGAMSKAILAEARETALMMSLVLGLSAMSLAVACAAVVIADAACRGAHRACAALLAGEIGAARKLLANGD